MNSASGVLLFRRAAMALSLSVAACGMSQSPPGRINPPPTTDGGVVGSDASLVKLPAPIVDPVPATVCGITIPLQGTAEPGAHVIVQDRWARESDPLNGRFCIPVELSPGTINQLKVNAFKDGRASEAVYVNVQHKTCTTQPSPTPSPTPAPPPKPPEPTNVALRARGKASTAPSWGNEAFLTDGDASTFVTYKGGGLVVAFDGWTMISLDKLYTLEKLVIRWKESATSGSGNYAKKYHLLVSNASAPGDPSVTSATWSVVAEVMDGDGGVDVVNLLDKKPLAQHIAIIMHFDATDWSLQETFSIAELEAWSTPQQGSTLPPPTGGDVCSNAASSY